MPFEVKHQRPALYGLDIPGEVVFRWVFATLDEAHRMADARVLGAAGPSWSLERLMDAVYAAARGDSVDLPDGSRITVTPRDWPWVAGMVDRGAYLPESRLLAAWNSVHGIGQ